MDKLEQIKSSIFKINTSGGTGSGFYLKDYDLVVTNYHVVSGSHVVALEDNNGDKKVANVIMVHPDKDVAFLKSEEKIQVEESVIINPEIEVKEKQRASVVGYPFGMGFTVTDGIISSPKQNISGRDLVQTDAAINPGNSGGPLLNENAELIGINTSKYTNADNTGFAIHVKELVELLAYVQNLDNSKLNYICHSCSECITEKTEYCPSCGAKIDKNIFVEKKLDNFVEFIEETISELDINPIITRKGPESWEFHFGAPEIRIFVYDNNFLYITSQLNTLPKKNLLSLYEKIFDAEVKPFQFGIYENDIYLSYRLAITDIFVGEKYKKDIKENIKKFAKTCSEFDEMFVKDFGCTRSIYSKDI